MINPVEYACNEHERQLYIENKIIIPSPYKIKFIDDVDERNKLEHILERLSQRELAIWANINAERFISYAIVSSDYAIKVINLLNNNSKVEAIKERNKQIELAKSLFSK